MCIAALQRPASFNQADRRSGKCQTPTRPTKRWSVWSISIGPTVDRPGFDRRAFLRRTALTGVAAGSVSTILAACGSSASSSGGSSSVFGSHKNYKFVFVNHVTTNPFFTPTQYGAADACKLLGCSYQWTGSESSNVNQMVNALNSAVTSGADGIAVALIDLHAFNAPVEAAIKAGIPVVCLQRRRAWQRAARLHRPGPETGRRKDGRTDRRGGRLGRRGAVHRDARLGEPAAADRRRRKGDQGLGQADHGRTRWRPARPCRASSRRSKPTGVGHKNTKGMYAVDGGSTESLAKVDAEARPGRQRRQGGRLRPDRKHPETALRKATSNSRSTSSPTCRASCRCCSCSCTRSRAR